MWKEKGKQILTGIIIGIVILLQVGFHIIEWLFHKVIAILTFLPNMALEVASIAWSIIASIIIIIIWNIAKLWNKLFKKDSSSEKK
ncbi:hypothetical protein CON65_04470 [Bacillus pseudomycoides]|uniref:DUF3975 domain-containing protein n=1 Tax=Bacillus pseudomycoides TaxID=64104 RepID=A0AA91VFW5_9BACI|nr:MULTISPECIES: DUF3975 family protein [Bacillus]PEB53308.1 hypothetical protein COO03_09095 [Bacillus sp. AFS098217]PED83823.1 hypothetical protein CON65_04470 [Bacillus pseudomycoides]PEU14707.1 hypothetical protein CN524_08425 [Bacillus sp. AFS019443]PEU19540.1 hypothetical protein CN525_07345 [Bacillus sp. AFS014408]PFW64378.1 hypothetical protein COL20_04365 [Bacillus sp. AFS075034]